MRNKLIIILAIAGVIAGMVSAYFYGKQKKPLPPVFSPASNPYGKGIYATGVIESYQTNGENVNIYPEVSGTITRIVVSEGSIVRRGEPLIVIEDSVQRALAEQQATQAQAALAVLEQLRAQPRKENLDIAKAQVTAAEASLKSSEDQLDKLRRSYEIDPRSVSRESLDTAGNAVQVSKANLDVVQKQLQLVSAGAWTYDIQNQEKQYQSSAKAATAARALLSKYVLTAPTDGVIMSINAGVGSYISPQGTYSTYTQSFRPVIAMGSNESYLGIRCYIDEILLHKLPVAEQMKAEMFLRGTDIRIPLEFVRVQPYVSPKIQLSSQRTERVDVRVLPVIFRFRKPDNIGIYSGQLVDVYIAGK